VAESKLNVYVSFVTVNGVASFAFVNWVSVPFGVNTVSPVPISILPVITACFVVSVLLLLILKYLPFTQSDTNDVA